MLSVASRQQLDITPGPATQKAWSDRVVRPMITPHIRTAALAGAVLVALPARAADPVRFSVNDSARLVVVDADIALSATAPAASRRRRRPITPATGRA